ncbi:hypothetical protein DL769_011497 [Monosporascus sp. CRB-8-3]|nr:hypothetical protein DL769_011497 [Monosporascus sp. CRB-8-3]
MDVDPDLQFAPEGDVREDETGSVNHNDPVKEDPVDEDDDEEGDGDDSDENDPIPSLVTLVCYLDSLAYKDLADLFSSPLPLSVGSGDKPLKKGAIIRYTKGVATSESRAFEYLIELLGDDHPIDQSELIFQYVSSTWIGLVLDRQTLALGGHILQWSGIERWTQVVRAQMRNPAITNEDMKRSAPKLVSAVAKLVEVKMKEGGVRELGDEFAVRGYFESVKGRLSQSSETYWCW